MLKTFIKKNLLFIAFLVAVTMSSCEKDIDIKVDTPQPLLVVEAYINNLQPFYNYVVLTRSQGYFSSNLQSPVVNGAMVTITEGQLQGGNIFWNPATTVTLTETNNPLVPASFRGGVYFDARLFTTPSQALQGRLNRYYLLQVETGGQQYSAVTSLLNPVVVDSVNPGFPFVDDNGISKMRITNFYQDPDTAGNRQLYYWRFKDNKDNFGWGGLNRSRAPGNDNLTNGQYIRLTHPQGFEVGDTVNYYMASVPRDVWNFWDSYNKALDNDGPFATPVTLVSNIKGSRVTGCFSGLALSNRNVVVR
jgi:hypothetical protein